jgi:alpha-keto-acid decarboxylase
MIRSSIADYLLQRLAEAGVGHVFGVPGDYILGFYDRMAHSALRHVGTTREDTAAFAADGYARCKGLGALAVTYGVGALNVVNACAGANAEHSPLVIISGAPGVREQREDPLLHHRFGPFTFQREIFERITCATAVLDDPVIAFRQIDKVLAATRRLSRPVYIELPRDRVATEGVHLPHENESPPVSDPGALTEAVAECVARLCAAEHPAVLAGVELHRRGLQDQLVAFIERAGLPVAATLTGKSVIGERHGHYLGVYEGAMGPESARLTIEAADVLLMLGVTLNDVDLGVYTAHLNPERMVRASHDEVVIGHHRYPRVRLADFLAQLSLTAPARSAPLPMEPILEAPGFPEKDRRLSIARLIGRLNAALQDDLMVVSDVGDCLFAALELRVTEKSEFLASAFYTTMGFAVPGALGAQIARPDRRALVLVGDGAFQMTGTEISTHARLKLAPIVIVFDNAGYNTERFILDGPFNDIAQWKPEHLGALCGPIAGHVAATEAEFETALTAALVETGQPSLIRAVLSPDDASPALRRLSEELGRRVRG